MSAAVMSAGSFPASIRRGWRPPRAASPAAEKLRSATGAANAPDEPATSAGNVGDILSPDGVLLDLQARSKRSVLALIATQLAMQAGLRSGEVQAALLRRERLGPTFIGNGVALPHARIKGLSRPEVVLARLRDPVSPRTPNGEIVDLVLAILWPAHQSGFVPTLARSWRLLRRPGLADDLRRSGSAEEICALIRWAEQRP